MMRFNNIQRAAYPEHSFRGCNVKYTQGRPQCLNYLLFDLLLILFVNNIRSFELFIDLGFIFLFCASMRGATLHTEQWDEVVTFHETERFVFK